MKPLPIFTHSCQPGLGEGEGGRNEMMSRASRLLDQDTQTFAASHSHASSSTSTWSARKKTHDGSSGHAIKQGEEGGEGEKHDYYSLRRVH